MAAEYAGTPPNIRPRQAIELTEGECWDLLRRASVGRVVFTYRAMPAIRPVNHLVDGHTIVFRTHLGAAIAARTSGAAGTDATGGTVVCYEADDLDASRHTGWSVITTGFARLVHDPGLIEKYAARLEPWIVGEMDQVVSIEPRFVSGIRLVNWCA